MRIICTDRKNHDSCPIIALVESDEYYENVKSFKIDGKWSIDGFESEFDLFFAPEKREGYVNVYRNKEHLWCGDIKRTETEAKELEDIEFYITTIKIEWEE